MPARYALLLFLSWIALALPAMSATPSKSRSWLQCMNHLIAASGKAEENARARYLPLSDGVSAAVQAYWAALDEATELEQNAGGESVVWALCEGAMRNAQECAFRHEELSRRARLIFTELGFHRAIRQALAEAFLPEGAAPYSLLTANRQGFRMTLPASLQYRTYRQVHVLFAPDTVVDSSDNPVPTYRMHIAVANREEATEIIERLYALIIGGRHRPTLSTTPVDAIYPLRGTYRGLALVGTGRSSGATLTLSFKPGHVSQYDSLRLIHSLVALAGLWPQ